MPTIGQLGYAFLQSSGVLAARRAVSPGPVILAYHNVVPEGQPPMGEASLHLCAATFAAQMEWLERHFEVVPLGTVGAEMVRGYSRKPLAALTFDDAYRGVFRYAVPILERLRMPATIFVVESASTSPELYWWDAVAESRPSINRGALQMAYGGRADAIFDAVGVDPAEVNLPDDYLPADWAEINAASSELIQLGAHTRTHPLLTSVDGDCLDDEVIGTRRRLGELLRRTPESVAYPYGGWDARVCVVAERAGYKFGVTIDRTISNAPSRALCLPRQTISSGVSPAAFAAAASRLRLGK